MSVLNVSRCCSLISLASHRSLSQRRSSTCTSVMLALIVLLMNIALRMYFDVRMGRWQQAQQPGRRHKSSVNGSKERVRHNSARMSLLTAIQRRSYTEAREAVQQGEDVNQTLVCDNDADDCVIIDLILGLIIGTMLVDFLHQHRILFLQAVLGR